MPTFREAIDTLLQADIPTSFKQFGNELDADFVQRALSETGVASVRRRKFPAEMVVWLVIGMALFRDRCIQEIVSHLGLVFGGRKESDSACRRIAPSAIPQARYRLGAKPLERIFTETGRSWAREAAEQMQWKGLGLYGVDGTTLRIADTKENRERFGAPSSRRAGSGYPQVRLVALMSLRAHLLATAAFGPYCGKQTGELSLARQLWDEVADNSLCVLDKLFLSYADLYTLSGQPGRNRHWIVPAKTNLKSSNRSVGVCVFDRQPSERRIPGSFRSLSEGDRQQEKFVLHTKKCRTRRYELLSWSRSWRKRSSRSSSNASGSSSNASRSSSSKRWSPSCGSGSTVTPATRVSLHRATALSPTLTRSTHTAAPEFNDYEDLCLGRAEKT